MADGKPRPPSFAQQHPELAALRAEMESMQQATEQAQPSAPESGGPGQGELLLSVLHDIKANTERIARMLETILEQ